MSSISVDSTILRRYCKPSRNRNDQCSCTGFRRCAHNTHLQCDDRSCGRRAEAGGENSCDCNRARLAVPSGLRSRKRRPTQPSVYADSRREEDGLSIAEYSRRHRARRSSRAFIPKTTSCSPDGPLCRAGMHRRSSPSRSMQAMQPSSILLPTCRAEKHCPSNHPRGLRPLSAAARAGP